MTFAACETETVGPPGVVTAAELSAAFPFGSLPGVAGPLEGVDGALLGGSMSSLGGGMSSMAELGATSAADGGTEPADADGGALVAAGADNDEGA